jgi:hypothetical protein
VKSFLLWQTWSRPIFRFENFVGTSPTFPAFKLNNPPKTGQPTSSNTLWISPYNLCWSVKVMDSDVEERNGAEQEAGTGRKHWGGAFAREDRGVVGGLVRARGELWRMAYLSL